MKIHDWINALFISPTFQVPTETNQFFDWYFYGLGGQGGWLIFLLLAIIATAWLFYDAQKRRLPAIGWKLAVVLLTLALLPTIAFRYTVEPVDYKILRFIDELGPACTIPVIQINFPNYNITATTCEELRRSLPPMTPYGEMAFYLGLLGGVLAPVVAAGYYITFQGMVGCLNGHVYEAVLDRCPYCPSPEPPPFIPTNYTPAGGYEREKAGSGHAPPPAKPTLGFAWLVDLSNNRRYDLCEGTTFIGRSAGKNDIVITDPAISRVHAQIRETNGHCTLSDLDSGSGTLLNGRRIRAPQVLQNGDRLTLGDTVMQFVTVR